MYASGLMSRQTPIWAFARGVDAARATREMIMIMDQSRAFLIVNQLYSDEAAFAVQVITLSKHYMLNERM